MRRQKYHPSYLFVLFLVSLASSGQARVAGSTRTSTHPEVERIRGFEDHIKEKEDAEKDRERGQQIYLEQIEIQKREYAKALEEYRRQRKSQKPLEETEAYRDYQADRIENQKKSHVAVEEFKADKAEEAKMLQQANLDPMRELGLPENRPRFDIKGRALYGAKPNFGKGSTGRASGGSDTGFTPPSYTPPENTFTPPGFDEFPPPPMDDSFDLPPPPPLPPMEGDLSLPQDDFFPPPPPPPPPMEDYQF